jgi:hypothetical protein
MLTVLLLLLPATGLSACAGGRAPPRPVVPASLLEHPVPERYPDPATATQADLIGALADTYFAWEETAANLDLVKSLLQEKEPRTDQRKE